MTTVETLTPATPVTSATSTVTLTECTAYDVSVTAKNGVCLATVKSIDDAYTGKTATYNIFYVLYAVQDLKNN